MAMLLIELPDPSSICRTRIHYQLDSQYPNPDVSSRLELQLFISDGI